MHLFKPSVGLLQKKVKDIAASKGSTDTKGVDAYLAAPGSRKDSSNQKDKKDKKKNVETPVSEEKKEKEEGNTRGLRGKNPVVAANRFGAGIGEVYIPFG